VLKLLKHIGEYKKYTFFSILVMMLEAATDFVAPFVFSVLIDDGLIEGKKAIIKYSICYASLSLFSLFFGILGAKFSALASTGLARNLRKELFNKIQDFSSNNINKFSNSSLITRLTYDVKNIQNVFSRLTRSGARAPCMMIGAFIMAVIIAKKLSIIFVIAAPILLIMVLLIVYFTYQKMKKLFKQTDEINLIVQENLSNIRFIKSFVREKKEITKFQKISNDFRKTQKFTEKIFALLEPTQEFAVNLCILFITYLGAKYVIKGEMKIGQVSAFLVYTYQILAQLKSVSVITMDYSISLPSIIRINEIFDEKINIKDNINELRLKDGSIEFKNVNFAYDKKLILKGINLIINDGETIGIIGGTASGKSTLVQLLPRLSDVSSGEIVIGKNDVKKYRLKYLREQVAMVLQKNVLFSGTIRENLLWGNERANDSDLIKVCKQVQAMEFIEKLPNGFDTYLERDATNLSGGQKQRLCIARALLKNPKIIILDDSMSAVDMVTDAKIRKVFKEELSHMTKIIIAQRVLSICDADKIVVMERGVIKGIGKHEELLKKNEIYKEICSSQEK
jgi:ATP-binding cassette subfamily B protein